MNARCYSYLIIYLCILSFRVYGDENDNIIFKLDSISEQVDLDKFWKYHPGDNILWAHREFDDSTWDTVSTQLNLLRTDQESFEGIAWFRLHLRIDSSLRNKTFALLLSQQGASEIYLNDSMIQSNGIFSSSTDKELTYNPKAVPGLIHFGEDLDYLLAIRYSNLNAHRNLEYFQHANAGFILRISDHNSAMRSLSGQVYATYLVLFLLMVFLILSMVHFLLFIFYRKQKSNLYYSLFMFLFSGLIFITFLSNGISEYPPLNAKAGFIMSMIFPLFFVPLTGFLYSLFTERTPRIFWITIGLAVTLSVLYLLDISIISTLYVGFVFLLWLEVTRIVIRAMIKKYEGAWIIGFGVLFFVLFFSLVIVYVIQVGDLRLGDQSIVSLVFGILLVAAILSIPLSMSIYLARDFARTNFNLEKQLKQVKVLSAKTIEQEREKKRILEGQKERLELLVKERTKELASEKEKSEELLLNTLPLKVVNELKLNGRSEPESFDDVTVYFSDIVGFTSISSQLEPKLLIHELNEIFTGFDDIMEKNSCERIKTIGDAYLAVSGMPVRQQNHAENMVRAALQIRDFLMERNKSSQTTWKVRIGIHTGRVVGGIVGVKKYIYDVFGDTINTTSRMESNSEPMQINVSETTYLLLKDKFTFTSRNPKEIKGKGIMKMFFLEK